MATYGVCVWTVKPGREQDFEQAWRELARFAAVQMAGHKEASRLFRDHDQDNRFVSVAQWDSADTIRAWRAGSSYSEELTRLASLLDDFAPMTLEDVSRA